MRLTEKYRPQTWDEVIGQDDTVRDIRNIMSDPESIPPLMFLGPSGCGKTTVANIIAKELGWPLIELNASDERGIAVVRGKIKQLTQFRGNRIILMDEADRLTPEAQDALRRPMELTKGTLLIFTGNYEHKFISAIKSRCSIFRFNRLSEQDVLRKLLEICKKENIKLTFNEEVKKGFITLVREHKGDLRSAINDMQKLIAKGEITVESVIGLRKPDLAGLALGITLAGDFEKSREMIEDAFITCEYSWSEVMDGLYEAIKKLEHREVKIRLYIRLGDIEARLRAGSDPIVQLSAFLGFAWIAPHLPKCPVLEESQ